MAIMGIAESENRHCILFYKLDDQKVHPSESTQSFSEKKEDLQLTTIQINPDDAAPLPDKAPLPHEKRHPTHANNMVHKFFSNKYAPFIMRNDVRLLAAFIYFGYALGAWSGCINYREGLEPNHLVTDSHYIAKYFEDMKLFWKVGPQLHVAIMKPPNFMDPVERFVENISLLVYKNVSSGKS